MRLACSWSYKGSPALKYSDIIPSSITCKRCLKTWTVRNHVAAVRRMYPEMREEELWPKKYQISLAFSSCI
jgi:hypothetical protein